MSTGGGRDLDDPNQDANLDERDVDSHTPLLRKSLTTPISASKRLLLLFPNWWLWEILSASTAVTAIAAITIILVAFNQSALPDWPTVFTVRSYHNFAFNLPLKSCVDKFSHLFVCDSSEAFYHVGRWSLDIAIEMVMVSSEQASHAERPSTF